MSPPPGAQAGADTGQGSRPTALFLHEVLFAREGRVEGGGGGRGAGGGEKTPLAARACVRGLIPKGLPRRGQERRGYHRRTHSLTTPTPVLKRVGAFDQDADGPPSRAGGLGGEATAPLGVLAEI